MKNIIMLTKATSVITLLVVGLIVSLMTSSMADAQLMAHWDFNQIENNTLKDIAGNNSGTLVGNIDETDIQPGLSGNALYFDSGTRYIKLKNSETITLTNDFTVECVIKPEAVTGYRTIFWKGNRQVSPEAINYYFDIRDGKPEIKFKDKDGNWIVYSTKPVLQPDHWYHIIFVYQKGNVEIYVNGEKLQSAKSEDGKGQTLLPNKYDAFIGTGASASNPNTMFYTGLIDDIKIYKGRVVNISDDYQNQWQRLLDTNKERTAQFDAIQQQQKAEREKKLNQEYITLFNKQAAQKNAPFTVTTLSSANRIVKKPDFFKELGAVSKIANISAARNEYEGFNIITLGSPLRDTKVDNVAVSDLVSANGKDRISADHITYGYIKDVTSLKPDIRVDFVGNFPDVIINGVTDFEVKKGSFTPVFVKVFTDDAKPGEYTGTVTITGEGHKEEVKIKLRVYDFTLPQKSSLRTAFSFFEQYYKEWYGLKDISDEQRRYIYNFLLDYRLSPNNIYASTQDTYPDINSLERMKNRTNFFNIRRYGNSKPVSEDVLQRQIKAIGDAIAQVKEAGLQDDMYYYTYDELMGHFTEDKLAGATQINTALRKAYPALKMMQTSFPDPRIEGLFNVWVPLFHDFGSKEKLATLQRLRDRGDEIWWYSADSPAAPYPNFFLDYSVFNERIISTLSYMYDIDGILYWSINREWATNMEIRKEWPNAVWKPYIINVNSKKQVAKNGMGNFIYPGPGGKLLPSPRLENLRDGLEDYEYLRELEKSVNELQKSDIKGNEALLKEAQSLLKVPSAVAVSVGEWSTDPSSLLKYRDQVGATISRINEVLQQRKN